MAATFVKLPALTGCERTAPDILVGSPESVEVLNEGTTPPAASAAEVIIASQSLSRYAVQSGIVNVGVKGVVGAPVIKALRLVREWAELYRAELQANWDKARARQPLDTIAPLP